MFFRKKKDSKLRGRTQEELVQEELANANPDFKYSSFFPWNEFFERFTKNCEEFSFIYKDKFINLVNAYGMYPAYSYGTEVKGYIISEDYKSPEELLAKARFDGKTLQEIWDDLR